MTMGRVEQNQSHNKIDSGEKSYPHLQLQVKFQNWTEVGQPNLTYNVKLGAK
jgi:hypothetical protein